MPTTIFAYFSDFTMIFDILVIFFSVRILTMCRSQSWRGVGLEEHGRVTASWCIVWSNRDDNGSFYCGCKNSWSLWNLAWWYKSVAGITGKHEVLLRRGEILNSRPYGNDKCDSEHGRIVECIKVKHSPCRSKGPLHRIATFFSPRIFFLLFLSFHCGRPRLWCLFTYLRFVVYVFTLRDPVQYSFTDVVLCSS